LSAAVEYLSNQATWAQIAEHLSRCDADFVPPLSGRVEICDYAQKIATNAMRFEAWSGGTLVGLVAAYCNAQEEGIAYVTSVSVLKPWTAKGIAGRLLNRCVEHAKDAGMQRISLEVASDSTPAIKLYEKAGFVAGKVTTASVTMSLSLVKGEKHE